MKFNWKIGGEAGFGIVTAGQIISTIATRSGYHIFDYMEYPSLIRGGHNTVEVVISDEPVTASMWLVDLLICLNKETYTNHKHRLHDKSVVVYDPDEFQLDPPYIGVPIQLKKIKQDSRIHQQMVNTIAIGGSLAIMKGELALFEEILSQQFLRKGQEVVDFNIKLARVGFDAAKEVQTHLEPILARKESVIPKVVMMGNDVFSLATVAADCKYYAAYPMTPSSTVLTTLAAWQYDNGMIVRHVEDEIAVINGALGASFAGARSAVGTSGGGLALMVEALSYAGIAEIPIVVFLSMRPGPATGMPTWTEQGDLTFAAFGGHGEFPKVVLTPGDVEEMADLTLKAYDLADIYQTPVIVASDKYLSESFKDSPKDELIQKLKSYTPNRGKIVKNTTQQPYLRYKQSEDGISEMLIPGQEGIFYQANSYEHIEDSHTSELEEAKIQQTDKRNQKGKTYLANHFELPKIYGSPETSDVIFVSWGSLKGPILEAQKLLKAGGIETAMIHFTHVYPMDEKKIQELLTPYLDKRVVLVENNSHAQFGQLLRLQTGITIQEKLLKYDGRPFWPEEIADYISAKKKEQGSTNIFTKITNGFSQGITITKT